jgi:hypothetical protein
MIWKIAVFCGSYAGRRPEYAQAARELGRLMGASGRTLVFGGCADGLMREVSRAVLEAGGQVESEFIRGLYRESDHIDGALEHIYDTLEERKAGLIGHSGGCIALPGSGFLLVSLFRSRFNAPRPYEALDIIPLMEKDKHGQSFPSRHVFSIFVIAMTLLRLCAPLGWALLCCGMVLAWCRVILGVHFPRDVIAGGIAGILWGLPGFFLPL